MPVSSVDVDLGSVEEIFLSHREQKRGRGIEQDDLIPLLQKIQRRYGYLPRPVLEWLSDRAGIPTSRIFGVVTFYAQFSLEPQGRRKILCCRGTACHVRGGDKVIRTVMDTLGVEEGGSTEDLEFAFETVACLGTCAIAPVMVVEQTYHGKTTPRSAEALLRRLMKREE